MNSTTEHTTANAFSSEDAIQIAKILLIILLSLIGTIGNIFMILAIAVEDHLKKAGNTFIMNVALADLLIASIFMPGSAITLTSKEEPILFCKIKWFLAGSTFITTVISLALQALENYVRLCKPETSSRFNMQSTATISFIVWFFAIVVTALQYTFEIRVDLCTNKSNDDIMTTVISLLVLFPLLLTFYIHMRIRSNVKHITDAPNTETDSYHSTDLSLARTNFYSFLIFLAFWLPFTIVFFCQRIAVVTNEFYYATAWMGLSKSCFHNLIYCIKFDHFRNVYVTFPNYCCNCRKYNETTPAQTDGTYAYEQPTDKYRYYYRYRRFVCHSPDHWERYNKYSNDLQRQERQKERRNVVQNEMLPFKVPMPIPCLNMCREVD